MSGMKSGGDLYGRVVGVTHVYSHQPRDRLRCLPALHLPLSTTDFSRQSYYLAPLILAGSHEMALLRLHCPFQRNDVVT